MRKLLLPLALCALLAGSGCDDDPTSVPETPQETRFSGTLILVDEEVPLPDLVVTLFEPVAQIAVGRDVSDSAGSFEFTGIPAGSYIPVVHSNGYMPTLLAKPQWTLAEGEQVDVVLRMRPSSIIEDTGYTLTGRVVDRDTQLPIANARIEMNFFAASGELTDVNWSEYRGFSTTLEATSDEDGMFFIYPLPVIGSSSEDRYIPNYRVTAPGYQSRVMDRNYQPETVNSILAGVRLSPGADQGSIEGYVRDPQGNPVAGVPVSAEWRRTDEQFRSLEPVDDPSLPDHILIPDGIAWSDETGYYRLTGLPRGFYAVEAGIFPDDGWVGEETRGAEIPGYAGTGYADVVVYRAVLPAFPADGETLDDTPVHLAWDSYPDAVRYEVLIRRDSDGNYDLLGALTNELVIDPADPFFRVDASYAWQVLARDQSGIGIGKTDRPHVFHVRRTVD